MGVRDGETQSHGEMTRNEEGVGKGGAISNYPEEEKGIEVMG